MKDVMSVEGSAREDCQPLTGPPGRWPEYWWHQLLGRGLEEERESPGKSQELDVEDEA